MNTWLSLNKRNIARTRLVVVLFALLLLLVGCSGSKDVVGNEADTEVIPPTQIDPTNDTLAQIVTPTSPPELTENEPSPVPTEVVNGTKSFPIETGEPTPATYQGCDPSISGIRGEPTIFSGLVISENQETERVISILTNAGSPRENYILTEVAEINSPQVSPNGEWLAYYIQNEESRSIEFVVTRFDKEEVFRTSYGEDSFLLPPTLRWLNDSNLLLSVANEGELFDLSFWSPFQQEEESVAIEMTGLGRLDLFRFTPSYDPLLELVIYPCSDCGTEEYVAKDMKSGEVVWTLDLDTISYSGWFDFTKPAWSYDGEHVAIIVGEQENTMVILNRSGEKVREVNLPNHSRFLAGLTLIWSPNSDYISFVYGYEIPTETVTPSIAVIGIEDGSLTDLCIEHTGGFWWWSPDGTRIAYSQKVASSESLYFLSVVDVFTVDIFLMDDLEGQILGWSGFIE